MCECVGDRFAVGQKDTQVDYHYCFKSYQGAQAPTILYLKTNHETTHLKLNKDRKILVKLP